MTEAPGVFRSRDSLREAFVDGLELMLAEHHDLGVFILALANASYDRSIYQRLQAPLSARFEALSTQIRTALRAGRPLSGAADDVLVFLKLMAVGLNNLEPTRLRRVGGFELQFNPLRAYRPARMSGTQVSDLFKPFDASGFHFNKPFLQKEVFWSGELQGLDCRLLYNKFPFAELHGLLVIEPQENKPQWLGESDHHAVWQIAEELGASLPGLGFAYNAYGAYSSVNHQHLQMFVRSQGEYPLESVRWRHSGGGEIYPLECHRYHDAGQAWRHIQRLHAQNRAYNLLYRPGCLYLLPRAFQGWYEHSDWTRGFAWSEVCGAITVFNAEDFAGLDGPAIREEMARLRG